MLNITLDKALDKNALLSTKAENDFKLGICIMPSDRIRAIFNQNGYRFNRGIDYCVVVDKTCDGLTDYMYSAMRDGDPWAADMTLRDIFIKEKDKNIDKINQILVESANENGGGDNITSILIKIHLR